MVEIEKPNKEKKRKKKKKKIQTPTNLPQNKQTKEHHHKNMSTSHVSLSGNKLLLHTHGCGRKGDSSVLNAVTVLRTCVVLASNIFTKLPKTHFRSKTEINACNFLVGTIVGTVFSYSGQKMVGSLSYLLKTSIT